MSNLKFESWGHFRSSWKYGKTSKYVKKLNYNTQPPKFRSSISNNKKAIGVSFFCLWDYYDEYIRLWDIRNMRSEMNSIKMPGTLWRLKWDPFNQNYLLAACMLGGAHIVDATDMHHLNIAGSYHEHKNISYGADWCHLDTESCDKFEQDGEFIIGTCSFYDHLLCISKFNSKKDD